MPPTTPPAAPKSNRPRRRWWSLSVRGLMLLVLLVGGLIGREANRVKRMRRAVAVLQPRPSGFMGSGHLPADVTAHANLMEDGRSVDLRYDNQVWDSESLFHRQLVDAPWPWWRPEWLRRSIGNDHFRQVSHLSFQGHPTVEDWKSIEDLESVTELWLHGLVFLSDTEVANLLKLSGLQTLGLSNLDVTPKAIASFNAIPNLRSLILDGDIGRPQTEALGSLRNVRSLDLTNTSVAVDHLKQLALMVQLEEIWLSDSAASDAGLAILGGMSNLRSIHLISEAGEITDLGVSHLKALTGLRELDISGCRLTDQALLIIAELPRLETLKIQPTDYDKRPPLVLSEVGVAQVGRLAHLKTLHLPLHLEVADDSWLEAIGKLSQLRDLRLAGRFTDDGLIYLEPLTQLEDLFIASPLVADPSLKHLRPLRRLRSLKIRGGKISRTAVSSLEATLPSLKKVTYWDWN